MEGGALKSCSGYLERERLLETLFRRKNAPCQSKAD
jgi:hypothetical protein